MSIDSTRVGFRDGLIELAEKRDDIVFVSTDSLAVVRGAPFKKQFPEHTIELGISEQNGVGVCAGLASSGFTPFICTYAGFLTMRACEQMRTFVAYPKLKVRFVGANGGLHGGNREGVSHQSSKTSASCGPYPDSPYSVQLTETRYARRCTPVLILTVQSISESVQAKRSRYSRQERPFPSERSGS